MKSLKIVAMAALVSTSLITTPSFATTATGPNAPSLSDMETVCAAYDSDGAGEDYQVVTTPGSVDMGAPTNDLSTVADIESTRVANHSSLSSPYGPRSFYGTVGRHGGSPNLFSTVGYPGITYAGSFVDQQVDQTETDTYHFSCQVQKWDVVGTHQEPVPAVPPQGYYTNPGTNPSGGGGSCQGLSPDNPHWGSDIGACIWTETAPGTPATTQTVNDYGWVNSGDAIPQTLTDGPYYAGTVPYASHVSEAVAVTETNAPPYFAGDAVVCNSPGKKGGTWTAQNGWTDMTKCTTTYFNGAPYISGANVFSSNSLPPL